VRVTNSGQVRCVMIDSGQVMCVMIDSGQVCEDQVWTDVS